MHDLNEINRFGSAGFVDEADVARAGMFTQHPHSFFAGFYGRRPLYYSDMGGVLLVAGARSGKLRDILSYNLCSGLLSGVSLLCLDMKGELAAISQDQTPDRKHCIYWNPSNSHGLPQHRVNPVDYININNPNLVSDVKVFCENMIPLSGSAQGEYFELRVREFLEGIILTLVQVKGVLALPDIYHVINLIPGGGDAWLEFGFEMSEAHFEIARRIEEEIAASRQQSGNGFQGIMGELFKGFACLSDPTLMQSVSPYADGSFDFSLSQLCESNQLYQFYLMPPAEFIQPWAR